MGRFNLDEYSPVEERIGMFYADHPEGRILTAIERLDPPLIVIRAEIYRTLDGPVWATGHAYEKEGEGNVNRTSYIENCETSAIGRALANAGYHGKRDGAPRPSREEMEKVERMERASNGTAPSPASVQHFEMACPACDGPMWDNRESKRNPKQPDFKCKDKEGCDHAIWLGTWERDLRAAVTTALADGYLGDDERLLMEERWVEGDPAWLSRIAARLDELRRAALAEVEPAMSGEEVLP